MSARALLNNLRVVELPMKYEERIGRSKLSVVHDGVRFLRAILGGMLCYRPEKIFLAGFGLCMLVMLLLAANPAEFYFANRRLEEWMIYRFVACFLLGSLGLLLLLATALTNRMAHLSPRRLEANMFWPSLTADLLRGTTLGVLIAALLAASLFFLWPGIIELTTTGRVYMHWSRLLAGAFALFSIAHVLVFAVLLKVVAVWRDQRVEADEVIALTQSPDEIERPLAEIVR
jgi:ABC-type iron transport system FetAB permease component